MKRNLHDEVYWTEKQQEAHLLGVRSNELLSRINLAIAANGGEVWRKKWCQCDSSVGYAPCEYCAIYTALREAKDFIINAR